MKSVLLSIQPKWCDLIASGKKTVEVRKTRPKIEAPFKVYIYMTKAYDTLFGNGKPKKLCVDGGKVIGEFVCDAICDHSVYKWREGGFEGLNYKYNSDLCTKSCLSQNELRKYGNRKTLYGWHISDLLIYDKPKELREFYNECEKYECDDCPYLHFENTPNSYEGWCEVDEKIPITRPPQGWCYVEELKLL